MGLEVAEGKVDNVSRMMWVSHSKNLSAEVAMKWGEEYWMKERGLHHLQDAAQADAKESPW